MEWARDGVKVVGGSYRTHITKTLNPLTGTAMLNTLANRSSPLPLLVVHSGNTTIGRLAVFLISSIDEAGADPDVVGTCPVKLIIWSRETCLNPTIGIRVDGVRAACWMFAEPVPVLRPGVYAMGVADPEDDLGVELTSGEGTGRMKTGLNLGIGAGLVMVLTASMEASLRAPDRQPE